MSELERLVHGWEIAASGWQTHGDRNSAQAMRACAAELRAALAAAQARQNPTCAYHSGRDMAATCSCPSWTLPTAAQAQEQAAPREPVMWNDLMRTGVGALCHPGDRQTRLWMLMFDDAERRGDTAIFTDETQAKQMFADAEARGWNCHLFVSADRAPAAAKQGAQEPHLRTLVLNYADRHDAMYNAPDGSADVLLHEAHLALKDAAARIRAGTFAPPAAARDVQRDAELAIGDLVAAADPGQPLCCGSGVYSAAVVVSVEPFVLVSEEGDMLWRHFPRSATRRMGHASTNAKRAAMDRFKRDAAHSAQGEAGQ